MSKKVIYDFGGCCRAVSDIENAIIVDIQSKNQPPVEIQCNSTCKYYPPTQCKKNNYIRANIFKKDLQLPEKASFINVSRVLTYSCKHGYLESQRINHKKLVIAAENIERNCDKSAKVQLIDHIDVLEDVIEYLIDHNFKIIFADIIEPRDIDYPPVWKIILQR